MDRLQSKSRTQRLEKSVFKEFDGKREPAELERFVKKSSVRCEMGSIQQREPALIR